MARKSPHSPAAVNALQNKLQRSQKKKCFVGNTGTTISPGWHFGEAAMPTNDHAEILILANT